MTESPVSQIPSEDGLGAVTSEELSDSSIATLCSLPIEIARTLTTDESAKTRTKMEIKNLVWRDLSFLVLYFNPLSQYLSAPLRIGIST